MTTQRKSYSRQFKIDAVKLVTDRGYKISEAARNLEIKAGLGVKSFFLTLGEERMLLRGITTR